LEWIKPLDRKLYCARFEVFLVVTPRSIVVGYQFRGPRLEIMLKFQGNFAWKQRYTFALLLPSALSYDLQCSLFHWHWHSKFSFQLWRRFKNRLLQFTANSFSINFNTRTASGWIVREDTPFMSPEKFTWGASSTDSRRSVRAHYLNKVFVYFTGVYPKVSGLSRWRNTRLSLVLLVEKQQHKGLWRQNSLDWLIK
jgi:hypothetical protein